MTKLCWMSDIHLNFLHIYNERKEFYEELKDADCDAYIITGDIGEANDFNHYLDEMRSIIPISRPIYFVLGNHDYYLCKRVLDVRAQASLINDCIYLTNSAFPFALDVDSYIVGVDGWADGREGNYSASPIRLNDSQYIADLAQAYLKKFSKFDVLQKMQELADNDAYLLTTQLSQIPPLAKNVVIATHVPPFKETANYRGRPTDEWHLPFYTTKVLRSVILEYARKNRGTKITVLSGHTHGLGNYKYHNIVAKNGRSEYYVPIVNEIIEL